MIKFDYEKFEDNLMYAEKLIRENCYSIEEVCEVINDFCNEYPYFDSTRLSNIPYIGEVKEVL